MQLATIDTIHTQGSLQNTNRELDLGISGDGYFRLAEMRQVPRLRGFLIRRAGNFYLDQDGDIVNTSRWAILVT